MIHDLPFAVDKEGRGICGNSVFLSCYVTSHQENLVSKVLFLYEPLDVFFSVVIAIDRNNYETTVLVFFMPIA